MAEQLKAIVHKEGPRIVLAITTDADPKISEDVEAVDITEQPDFESGSRYKILNDDLTFRDATDKEIDDADVDPAKRAEKHKANLQQFKDAMDVLIVDDAVPQTVKDFVVALKRLY